MLHNHILRMTGPWTTDEQNYTPEIDSWWWNSIGLYQLYKFEPFFNI